MLTVSAGPDRRRLRFAAGFSERLLDRLCGPQRIADPGTCPHPVRRLVYDGCWDARLAPEGLACVTCLDCGTTLAIPARHHAGHDLADPCPTAHAAMLRAGPMSEQGKSRRNIPQEEKT